jgi:hypothetical protein
MTFSIFESESAGVQLWEEIHPSVDVESGLFSVVLGSLMPIPESLFDESDRWLQIAVAGEIIVPRTKLTTSPYAFASGSVRGDLETEPGKLTLSDSPRAGGYLQLHSATTGNYVSLVAADPTDEGGFSMFSVDMQTPLVEMQASGSGFRDFSMYSREANDKSRISFYDVSGGGPDTALQFSFSPATGPTIRMFDAQAADPNIAAMELFPDLLVFQNDCGSKRGLRTSFLKCGMLIDDPSGETLFVANQLGIFMKTMPGRADYEAYLSPTGLKLEAGASDGYVMTSDADGVGSWQPAAGGSMPGGVAQAVDATDQDTLYSDATRTFISQSIDCPSSGYVLVIGSCDATVLHHEQAGNPRFMFGVSNKLDTLDSDQRKEWYFPDLYVAGHYSTVIAAQKIYPVSTGVNTFYMAGYRSNTTGCTDSCWIDNKTLSLVFIPEAYGTVELAAVNRDLESPLSVSVVQDDDRMNSSSHRKKIEELESEIRRLSETVNQLLQMQQ